MESFLVVSDVLPAPGVIWSVVLEEGAAMIRLITVAMGNPILRMPEVVNDMMKELE